MGSDTSTPASIAVVVGTGLDAVRLGPVVQALRRMGGLAPVVIATGAAPSERTEVLALFDIGADVVIHTPPRAPHHITSPVVARLREVLARLRPARLLVAGDSATAFAAAVAAYDEDIAVAHLALGRATAPFGELNRRMVDDLAGLLFVSSDGAAAALRREGVSPNRIRVTGDPLVDGMRLLRARPGTASAAPASAARIVFVAARGRESLDAPFRELCLALRRIVEERPDVRIVYPVHRDQDAGTASVLLGDEERVSLLEPIGPAALAGWVARAHLVLTDSDDVQVAAAALGKPVLVVGDAGARGEGIAAGVARAAGLDSDEIYDETATLLDDQAAYRRLADARHPYGDGDAATRIARALADAIGVAAIERSA